MHVRQFVAIHSRGLAAQPTSENTGKCGLGFQELNEIIHSRNINFWVCLI